MIYENNPVMNTSPAPIVNSPLMYFKSPTTLTGILKGLLLAAILLMFVNFYHAWNDNQYLQSVLNSSEYQSGQVVEIKTPVTDLRILTTLLYTMADVAIIVTLLMWVYRTNKNTHSFGGVNLSFSPGWAVGWFFIPVANLIKPCFAMQEIYRASRNPVQWKLVPCSILVNAWWVCWIAGRLLGSPSRAHGNINMLETMLTFQKIHMGAMVVFTISLGLLFLIITEIADFQNALFRYLSQNPDKHPSAATGQTQSTENSPLSTRKPQTEAAPLYQHT